MHSDTITLFPPYGVDQTIHVAILIGVLVLLALTEWFGWVFSGLVVPGYLASLFVLEPGSGATVLFEAVLTYLMGRLISNFASRTGAWNLFFGRERFLLLVFISIAVRQASELWLLPQGLGLVDDYFGTTYRLTRTFSSVGLVLVPLTANMFWKLDLKRGVFQVGVPTVISYAVVRFVLLPYTNLSFSRLEITYENVALDFLSSPKAYILLITGAYLGSRWNLMYGWDYAGIMIPALLGLAWLSWTRLVTTLAETLLLVIVMRLLMRLPGFRTMNLEGPRKVALVFTVSFLLKWGIGWIVDPTMLNDMRITDLFGFGYLLSSLVAVKILQKDTFSRIAVPTFVVSVVSFVVGSLVGFGLDRLAPAPQPVPDLPAIPATPTTTVLAQTSRGVLALGHVRARLDVAADLPLDPSDYQLGQYSQLWNEIAPWLETGSEKQRIVAEGKLKGLQLALRPIGKLGTHEAFALFELEERLVAQIGWDTAVLVPGATGPVIVVPQPVTESPTSEVAAELCERTNCRAVLVSGVDTPGAKRPAKTAHSIAREAFAKVAMLELRIDKRLERGRSVLYVNETPNFNVAGLWPRGLALSWEKPPGSERRHGESVLYAHPEDYWQIVIGVSSIALQRETPIEAWFAKFFDKLLPRVRSIDPSDTDAPVPAAPMDLASDITNQPPSQSELRFLQELVARPALDGERGRSIANAMAGLVGYSILELPEGLGTEGAWVLAEAARPRKLGWGVLAGRTSPLAHPIAIEIPRPRREAGTWRLGVELWRHSAGSTLVVADGDVPDERIDADPAATWNVTTGFQAFHQALYDARRTADGGIVHDGGGDPAILEIRGFGVTQPIREAAVVTMPRPLLGPEQLPARIAALIKPDGALGFVKPVRLNDGAEDLVDVTGIGNPQLHYCSKFEGVDCAMLWFSELTRDAYKEVDRDREIQKLDRMKVPLVKVSAAAALVEPELAPPDPAKLAAAKTRFTELTRVAEAYSIEQNVQLLRVLVNRAAESRGVAVRGGFSDELGRPFVVVELHEGDLVMRGLVLVPSGTERIDLAAGSERAKHVPELLGRRPRLITYAGRSGEVVAPAPAKKRRGR